MIAKIVALAVYWLTMPKKKNGTEPHLVEEDKQEDQMSTPHPLPSTNNHISNNVFLPRQKS
jgi:hypothetical protein